MHLPFPNHIRFYELTTLGEWKRPCFLLLLDALLSHPFLRNYLPTFHPSLAHSLVLSNFLNVIHLSHPCSFSSYHDTLSLPMWYPGLSGRMAHPSIHMSLFYKLLHVTSYWLLLVFIIFHALNDECLYHMWEIF